MKVQSPVAQRLDALWKNDPLAAAKWVADLSTQAHAELPGLSKLKELLGLAGASGFDARALTQLAQEHPELRNPLGAIQQARAKTLNWEAQAPMEPPAFTGKVSVQDGQVKLETAGGTFDLAVPAQNVWLARWAAEVGAFKGQVVTVRGWPDTAGKAIAVDGFAPGTEREFVQGRVTRTEDGALAIAVRPDKQVRITHPKLQAKLQDYVRVGFILPGEAKEVQTPKGKQWVYDQNPDGYYMLTKLNPSTLDNSVVRYDADTPFEKTQITTTSGEFPDSKLGERIFVFGRIPEAGEDLGVKPPVERIRKFVASWVSEPIQAAWQKSAEALGKSISVEKGPEQLAVTLDPTVKHPAGTFAPDANVGADPVGSKSGRVTLKDGTVERWEHGKKLESGPVDEKGLPHGEWQEFAPRAFHSENKEGAVASEYDVSVKGTYEHGKRQGVWIQFKDGQAKNAWQYEKGQLVAAGHVDDQGRQHGAWTLVAADGLHDGGEGEFNHGLRSDSWWYFKPGTSEYARAEFYDDKGKISFEGDVRAAKVGDQTYQVRIGEWKFYDEAGKVKETKTYGPSDLIDANGKVRG